MRFLWLVFFWVIGLLLLIGCYNNDQELEMTHSPQVIRFSHNWTGRDGKAEFFEPYLEEIKEQLLPDFELIIEAAPPHEYLAYMQSKLSSGNAPDVYLFWATEALIKAVVDLGLAIEIEEYFRLSSEVTFNDFYDFTWNFTTLDEKKYAIPFEVFGGFFLVNTELFSRYGLEIPLNRDDFFTVGKEFVSHGHIPLAVSSVDGDPGHLFFSELSTQHGAEYSKALDRLRIRDFASEVNYNTARLIQEMVDNRFLPSSPEYIGTYQQMVSLYNSEISPMIYTFPWVIQEFDESIVSSSKIFEVPNFFMSDHLDRSSFIGGIAMAIFINPNSFSMPNKQKGIIQFVDQLLTVESFKNLAQGGMLPARSIELNDDELSPLFRMVHQRFDGRTPKKAHEIFFPDAKSFDIYRLAIDYLLSGIIDAQQFIEMVQVGLVE